MSFFFLYKSENRRLEQILPQGIDTSGWEEEVGRGCRRVNMMQILCTHVYKQEI
jgi:hypothetical protein